jgi:hypothetical protein
MINELVHLYFLLGLWTGRPQRIFQLMSSLTDSLLQILNKRLDGSWALVAHTYNPRYSKGRDQEDQGLRPTWGNSS